MPVETADDLAVFMNVDEFGVSATYTPQNGTATIISVIFDNDVQETDAGGQITFVTAVPRVIARTIDVPSAAEGDAITINTVDYIVLVALDGSLGTTELRLERQ